MRHVSCIPDTGLQDRLKRLSFFFIEAETHYEALIGLSLPLVCWGLMVCVNMSDPKRTSDEN